jgi:UDP-N-acetylbacillosamine N-acetyltransferase
MSLASDDILLFGCGGHSRSVADILLSNDPNVSLIFVDPNARENEEIYGFPVTKEMIVAGNQPVFVAIGDNRNRKTTVEGLGNVNLISVVSKSSHVGHLAQIGSGCFVGNLCHIGPEVILGANTIVNNAAVVEHEVHVGEYCHLGPNATVSGRCRIGDQVFVGVGATIKDFVSICSNVTIGAGATVVKNIDEPGVYVGTPAKRIK